MNAFKFLCFGLILSGSVARAQDVYNFYFQKTDHANEMVQVKNGEPVAATKASAPKAGETASTSATASVSTSDAAAPETTTNVATNVAAKNSSMTEKKDYWRFGFGFARLTDHVRIGQSKVYALSVDYGLNRYFALESQLVGGTVYAYDTGSFGASSTAFAGSLGLKATPVHIDLFGWDFIDLSISGGAMTSMGSNQSPNENTLKIVPYVGGEVAVNVAKNISLALNGKFESGDDQFGQAVFMAAYKF